MLGYKTAEAQQALEGVAVAHPKYGVGIIMGAKSAVDGIYLSVHFASGFRKGIRLDHALAELQALLEGSAGRSSAAELLSDPDEMASQLRMAQHNLAFGLVASEDNLRVRLDCAAGHPQFLLQPTKMDLSWL